jgi:hypothetical protein
MRYAMTCGAWTLVAAACHSAVAIGPPLQPPPEAPEPTPPQRDPAEGCISDRDGVDRFREQLDAYLANRTERMAAANGWRRLGEEQLASPTSSSEYTIGKAHLRKQSAGRFVDETSRTWLLVAEEPPGRCLLTGGAPLFIDRELQVFRVFSAFACAKEVRLDVCGQIPVRGCGTAQPLPPPGTLPSMWFVEVPEDARALYSEKLPYDRVDTIRLSPPLPACFEVVPRQGFIGPP